jgi:hypothetical protein
VCHKLIAKGKIYSTVLPTEIDAETLWEQSVAAARGRNWCWKSPYCNTVFYSYSARSTVALHTWHVEIQYGCSRVCVCVYTLYCLDTQTSRGTVQVYRYHRVPYMYVESRK